ncbi:polyphosphate kinase 1 [Marivirga sp. S37H4]|uniref:Polyphosphate kinase n=1 Tax=Marivirga aurantiaca TaxID=2802615 RepID=A0A935C5V3_9BACT|nr:polyphosphate kinase 1 [Marivirga aurantiaca]MBK6264024.1 polyphosphate kinase 1 [Marivirga aurantiaca]
MAIDRINDLINRSNLVSRDLSWLQFNYRVLDQARQTERNVFERLKFLAITASNLDEFFMIRVGSLYNYIDYGRERVDYSGLRELPFRKKLLTECQDFVKSQNKLFSEILEPLFEENDFKIVKMSDLKESEMKRARSFFDKIIFPMLTPMVYDNYHTFPILMNKLLIFSVVTRNHGDKKDNKKLSFIQMPQNIQRFFEIERDGKILFLPIEELVRANIDQLFRNIEILSVNMFRITRNGDFTLEESDDIEANFLEEMRKKLKTRKTGRVVRIEIDKDYDKWMMKVLSDRWEMDKDNIFKFGDNSLLDYAALWQVIKHNEFKDKIPETQAPVPPLTFPEHKSDSDNIFEILKDRDILLHHPYNNIEPVLDMIEKASDDPKVLSIKLTIYRLARNSRIVDALLKATENGIHVSVLFEVKARFDEENNIREAKRLQKAGCFVIYGISRFKTHTKLLMIVRKEGEKVTRYLHMASGNYNEETARLYTDIGLMTTDEVYAQDISEFFNVITGHSHPQEYERLITAPKDMRNKLIALIRNEANNAREGLPSGICIKINSLEDKEAIDELYAASQAGVSIKLIVRGICCLRPGRIGLSENISVCSIVGNYLEHSRIYYFHNNGEPKVYGGSADMMVRSFERRLESLFLIVDETLKKQVMNILRYNLRDNVNSYIMNEDGSYSLKKNKDVEPFNIHKEFYKLTPEIIEDVKLF